MPFVVFRRDHLRFTSGIICGSGSFAVQFGDHFRSGDHLRSGIICGAVQAQKISGDKMVPKGNRERMCKYVTIYPKLNRVVHGVVHGVGYGVVVSVFNSPIHMHVLKIK